MHYSNAILNHLEESAHDYHTHFTAKYARNTIIQLIHDLRVAREIAVTPDHQINETHANEVQKWSSLK